MHSQAKNSLAFLRSFSRPAPTEERCELCSAALTEDHEHLVEPAKRRLVCACTPCAILFGHREAGNYRRPPRQIAHLQNVHFTDLQWESFGLPIALAFLHFSTPAGRLVAVYPSPAGATEAAVPRDSWEELLEANSELRGLEPDVEALLINRVGASRDYFRLGIDHCYRLAGLLRKHWQGFSGGDAVWAALSQFFDNLKRRAGSAGEPVHA